MLVGAEGEGVFVLVAGVVGRQSATHPTAWFFGLGVILLLMIRRGLRFASPTLRVWGGWGRMRNRPYAAGGALLHL